MNKDTMLKKLVQEIPKFKNGDKKIKINKLGQIYLTMFGVFILWFIPMILNIYYLFIISLVFTIVYIMQDAQMGTFTTRVSKLNKEKVNKWK